MKFKVMQITLKKRKNVNMKIKFAILEELEEFKN